MRAASGAEMCVQAEQYRGHPLTATHGTTQPKWVHTALIP